MRRDGLVSYNLAVVADDIDDGVNDVVRGSDLLEYTAVQMQLWSALGAAPPRWLHTPLVLGADGRKLSKSHGSAHVGAMRDAGATPADVWRLVLPWLGVAGATSLAEAVPRWEPTRGERGPIVVHRLALPWLPRLSTSPGTYRSWSRRRRWRTDAWPDALPGVGATRAPDDGHESPQPCDGSRRQSGATRQGLDRRSMSSGLATAARVSQYARPGVDSAVSRIQALIACMRAF